MTLQNAISEVKKSLPSEMRIHPCVASAVRELVAFAESGHYRSTLNKDEMIDTITNMVDVNIRKSRCETYDEWQSAVESLLTRHEI